MHDCPAVSRDVVGLSRFSEDVSSDWGGLSRFP